MTAGMSTWAPEHDPDLLNIQWNVAMKDNDVVKMVTVDCVKVLSMTYE